MKKIAIISLVIVSLGALLSHAQPQLPHENPAYGADSAARMDCANNLSTMSEFMKIDLYDYALASWNIVYNTCPASSKNIYIYGVKIFRERFTEETDPARKAEILDSLMTIYDKRIVHFGQEGLVIGRKGLDLLRYDKKQVEASYGYLKRSMEVSTTNTEESVIVTLMQTSQALMRAGAIDGRELIDNYLVAMDILEKKLKTGKSTQRVQIAINNVEAIFANCGAADCDALVEIFTPKFEETPDNLEFLKKITTLLSDQNCEDTKLFADASENLYQLEPSSQAAYNLARLFYKKEDIEKSIVYYREAIGNATEDEDEDKAKYNYELGLIQFSKYDNKQLARTYALSAIESMPEWGEPYILIGNLYASSSSVCGENDFEKTTIFWAAVDKFQKAKALDPEVNGEAAELINRYSQYFPNVEDAFFYGFEDGQPYKVGCWINENTKVRTRKRP